MITSINTIKKLLTVILSRHDPRCLRQVQVYKRSRKEVPCFQCVGIDPYLLTSILFLEYVIYSLTFKVLWNCFSLNPCLGSFELNCSYFHFRMYQLTLVRSFRLKDFRFNRSSIIRHGPTLSSRFRQLWNGALLFYFKGIGHFLAQEDSFVLVQIV